MVCYYIVTRSMKISDISYKLTQYPNIVLTLTGKSREEEKVQYLNWKKIA